MDPSVDQGRGRAYFVVIIDTTFATTCWARLRSQALIGIIPNAGLIDLEVENFSDGIEPLSVSRMYRASPLGCRPRHRQSAHRPTISLH